MKLNELTDIKSLKEPLGWMGHLPFAKFLVQVLKPGVFVELGTHTGNSYFSFCQSAVECKLDCAFYAVDTWEGDDHSERYEDEVFETVQDHNKTNYSEISTLKRMTFDEALDDFENHSIDLLHIDGFHSYEAVSHDFNTWLPKVKKNGVVLFHDICEKTKDFGVWRYWEELKRDYPTMEFHHSHGLGILFLSDSIREKVNQEINAIIQNDHHSALFFELASLMINEKHISQRKTDQIDELSQRFHNLALENQKLVRQFAESTTNLSAKLDVKTRLADTAIANNHILVNSTSWKLTAPVRFIGLRIKGVLNPLRLILNLTRQRGLPSVCVSAIKNVKKIGFLNSIKKVSQRFQNDSANAEEYQNWIQKYDWFSESRKSAIQRACDTLDNKPLISVLVPCFNPDITFLCKAIESVRNQVYENWELCIADDCSTDPQVKQTLESYQKKDQRIKVVFREENGHISACSNSAIELVQGDYTALLDNDDVLHPEALYWVARQINETPEAVLIYTDEDKLDEAGMRTDPYFKPDFNYELFLSQNHISHLGVYKTEIIKKLKGFREKYDGAQDWDLALRVLDECGPEGICHIPRVLYHWRISKHSTAKNLEAKPYAAKAQMQVIEGHFDRSKAKESGQHQDTFVIENTNGFQVNFSVPAPTPLVTIIIPTKNGFAFLKSCIDSVLERTLYSNYEILIIDNGTDDKDTLNYFESLKKKHKNVFIHEDAREFNFSALNNAAAKIANGSYLCLLNNDITIITPQWLNEMVSLACRPGVGAVGAKLYYPDDTVQHAGVILGLGGVAGHIHKGIHRNDPGYFNRAMARQELSCVTAACLVVQKDIFWQAGGFDEEHLAVAFNDVDLCLKIQKQGYRNVWTPFAECYHHESVSRGYEDNPEKQARFTKEVNTMLDRWGDTLTSDPFFNPNFSFTSEDYAYKLSFPPRFGMISNEDME